MLTKCDAQRRTDIASAAIETSSVTGHGVASLQTACGDSALAVCGHGGDMVASTAARAADALRLVGQCLRQARQVAGTGQDELVAVELRAALEELGKIVGAIYNDDVLDRIFSRFCIGK